MSVIAASLIGLCRRTTMPTITKCYLSSTSHLCANSKSPSNSSNDSYTLNFKEYKARSPYKITTPTRYGYEQKLFDGGLLPRIEQEITTMPKYRPSDAWSEKKALFGQNDYIDILGESDIKPHELIKGPNWLIGFRGNEFQRTLRRLKFTGRRLAATHPKIHSDLNKRLRYLYRQFNMGRKSHRSRSKDL